MDTRQQLQQAEDIKEKGKELFQKKLYKEAECQYNQVLEHLPPVANLTGEVKERRDNLAVAAHLNLALCQLRLSGNSTNIKEHCDEALKINPDSVKAYYRRAQAHQIDQGYQLAIKDYRQVLVLEPSNMAAQTQLQLCHTLLQGQGTHLPPTDVSCKTVTARTSGTDGKPDISGRLSLAEDADQTEYHDMEVGVECEADCFRRYSKCPKAAYHDKFIALADFTPKHLPPPFQSDQELYELILLQAKLAVRLSVTGASDKRPKTQPNSQKPYPFSSDKDKHVLRVGSGWVSVVVLHTLEDKKDCPCESCQKSGTPAKEWGEIFIDTAAHVVFDTSEGQNSKCRFFYDSDKMSLSKCSIVQAAVKVESIIGTDSSRLTFISHDMGLVKQLFKLHCDYVVQSPRIKHKYTNFCLNEPKTGLEMLQGLSSLQARADLAIQLYGQLIEELKAAVNNVTPQWLDDYTTWLQSNGYPDEDILSSCVRNKLKGGQEYKRFLEKHTSFRDCFCGNMKMINDAKKFLSVSPAVFDTDPEKRKFLLNFNHGFCYRVEQVIKLVDFGTRNLLDKRQAVTTVPSPEKPVYDPAYPLTVIVSHPHGLSKKISIGEVVDTEEFRLDEVLGRMGLTYISDKAYTRHKYNNVTCPGSSGAQVYILGKVGLSFDPRHGGSKRITSNGQINEAVISVDFLT